MDKTRKDQRIEEARGLEESFNRLIDDRLEVNALDEAMFYLKRRLAARQEGLI